RLAGEVPAVIGLRQGLLFSEWLDAGGPGLADASLPATLGSYVANRVRRLPLSEDPCFQPPRYRWTGWDELSHLLRRVYGPYVGRLKRRALTHQLRRYVAPRPTVVDGHMRPGEWIGTWAGLRKVDAEQHNFGGGELDVVDPAYDLAAAAMEHSLSRDQVDELLGAYRRQGGDPAVSDRLILYDLLYGVVTMNRAAEAAAHETRP